MTKEIKVGSSPGYKQMLLGNGYYTSCFMGEEDYMNISPIWKQLREDRMKKDHNMCQNCGAAFPLNVHHRKYPIAWGMESIDDLVTLCEKCHTEVHANDKRT